MLYCPQKGWPVPTRAPAERKLLVFSLLHLATLLLFTCLVSYCCVRAKAWSRETVHCFFKAAAVIMLFFDPTYWTWEWLTYGAIDLSSSLPLYICSLFWMLLPVAVFAQDGILKQMSMSCLSTVCMLGGVMGLIFNPHVGNYPFFSFVPLYSLIYHFMIVLVVALLWATGYYVPRTSDRYLCMIPVFLLVSANIPLNHRYGWDYCFTGGGIGTPFELVSRHVPLGVFLLLLYGGMALLIGWFFYPRVLREK